jgi:hypothetical protein
MGAPARLMSSQLCPVSTWNVVKFKGRQGLRLSARLRQRWCARRFRSDIESFINRPRRGPLPVNWTTLSDEYYSSRSEIFSFDLNARGHSIVITAAKYCFR